jgi:hypothetical protein
MDFALASRTGGVPRVLDRRISNAGRVADIRKRDPQQIFTTGGIQKFSMLGSQNAISYVPIAFPTKKESGTQTDAGTGTDEPKKPILPGMTKKETGTGTGTDGLIGGGGTQSEASKTAMGIRKVMEEEKAKEEEAKKTAVEPSEKPPFDLSNAEGKKAMEEYDAYVVQRYGKDAGNLKSSEVKTDSEGFTLALKSWKEINRAISSFNLDDKRRWTEWANNTFKKYGDDIIGVLSVGAGTLYPGSKVIIDDIAKELKKFKPKDEKDFVGSMKQLQTKLFEGRPEWRKKIDKLVTIAWNNFMEKYKGFPGMAEEDEFAGMGKKKPGLMMATKKETEPEPKTYPKTKEGVKQYKADNPKASQRAIAEALGMSKTTVLRYLK